MNAVWFFDDGSEWPLNEKQVAQEVQKDPRAAYAYHVARTSITYAEYVRTKPVRSAAA